jgi:THUMP domain-containing protein/RNA cap guanine-N2 methyltransferase
MELSVFRELLTSAGQASLADAAALAPSETGFLTAFEKLRKRHAPALARAALETVLLRSRARAKFAAADRMYFTREALEQATGDLAARHRARRFTPFGVAADLCCGIGGDSLALAAAGLVVHAVDKDPLRLAMAEANALSLGLANRITFHLGDTLAMPLPPVHAAFADPARRTPARRHLNPEEYEPPLSALRARFAPDFPLAIKIAPGVAWKDVEHLGAEVEFVSVGGELKECVLWFGNLRRAARRATLLPSEATLAADDVSPLPAVVPPGAYLFDPDPAVVRAGLAGQLATELRLSPIDRAVMLFAADEPIDSPFVAVYRIELAARFNAAALRDHLRARGVGRVTIVKRGSPADANEVEKKLKLVGSAHRAIVLTRAAGEQVMIVGQRL